MKRFLVLLLTIVTVLSLTGCPRSSGKEDEPFSVELVQLPDLHTCPGAPGRPSSGFGEKPRARGDNLHSHTAEKPDSSQSSIQLRTTGQMPYYLYTPANPQKGMTLIIYLHGSSMRVSDVSLMLTNEGFPLYLQKGTFGDLRAYVAIPKIDESYRDWSDAGEQISEMIRMIQRDCGIDIDRVALTGHSLGGSGTWQLAIRLPGTFACIAPVSGGVACTDSNLSALARTRVWAFVGTADTVVDPQMSRDLVSALQKMGASAQITELKGATHRESCRQAYTETDLMAWLVSCGK